MKKLAVIGVIAVLAAGMLALTGCGNNDKAAEETTTEPPTTTTEAPTTTTEATKEAELTYQSLYGAKLDELLSDYGSGVTGGRLVDMDEDGTPEMIIFHGSAPSFTTEIFTIRNDKVENIYEKTLSGLRYAQTDVSYQVWINKTIDPTALTLFNSKDEWVNEEIHVVTYDGNAASEKILKANTDGENDDPDRSWLQNFTINDGGVSAKEYRKEYNRLKEGADVIDPTSAGLDDLKAAIGQ